MELARVRFATPSTSVITNVEATPNADPGRTAELLEQQVTAPVRFVEMIEQLVALGVTRVLEIGTGRVLNGLVARIARPLERSCLASLGDIDEAARFALGTDVERS